MEPVTLQEAKDHLRLTSTEEDGYVSTLIIAAREHVEQATGRPVITQSWRLLLDRFPDGAGAICLKPNLQQVTALKYLDENGTQQTLDPAAYQVHVDPVVGLVEPVYDTTWPDHRRQRGAVTVDFDCGYGNRDDVPQPLRQAMLLLIGHWFGHREAVITGTISSELPMSVRALLAPYEVPGT